MLQTSKKKQYWTEISRAESSWLFMYEGSFKDCLRENVDNYIYLHVQGERKGQDRKRSMA